MALNIPFKKSIGDKSPTNQSSFNLIIDKPKGDFEGQVLRQATGDEIRLEEPSLFERFKNKLFGEPTKFEQRFKRQFEAEKELFPEKFTTPLRIPFTKGGQIPFTEGKFLRVPKSDVLSPLISGFAEGTLEAIPGLLKTIGQVPQVAEEGRLPRPTEETRIESTLEIGGAISDVLQDRGVPADKAEILGGGAALGIGILDAFFTRSIGRTFTKGTLKNVAVPDEIHQIAWQKLGRAGTKEEALKIANELLREVSPNSSKAVRQGTVDEILAQEITSARNIILEKGVPTGPSLSARALRNFARTLEADVTELATRGLGPEIQIPFVKPAGLLPGLAPPEGRLQPRVGLTAQPLEPVGGGRKIPKELEPLAKEARKFDTAEEFVESQLPKQFNLKIKEVATLRGAHGQFSARENLIRIPAKLPKGFNKEDIIAHEIGHFAHKKLAQSDLDSFNALVKSFKKEVDESLDRIRTFEEKGGQQGFLETFADLYGKYLRGEKLPAGNQFKFFFDDVAPAKTKPQLTDFFNKVKGEDISQKRTEEIRETTLLKERLRNIQREIMGARKVVGQERAAATREERTRIVTRLKELNKIIDESNLTLKDKAKFRIAPKQIAEIKSEKALNKKIQEIINRVEKLEQLEEARILRSQIIKDLKTTKPKRGQKKALESKFGPQATKDLAFLRGETDEAIKLTGRKTKKGNIVAGVRGDRIKAQGEIENIVNKFGETKDGVAPEIPLEEVRKIALLNMIGIQDMNAAQLKTTLENIRSLKQTGELAQLVAQQNKTAALELVKDAAKETFKPTKPGKTVLGESTAEINPIRMVWNAMDNALLGIEHIVEKATYGKQFTVAEWADDLLREARGGYARTEVAWGNQKAKAFKNIFGKKELGKTWKELNERKVVFEGKDRLGKEVTMELSQLEAAYWHALAKDPTNTEMFIRNMNFTDEMFQVLDDFVTPKMKEYVKFLQDEWLGKTIYDPVNVRYQEKFGMDLPKNEKYMARLYSDKPLEEEVTNLLVGEAFPSHPSTVPSGVKARIGSKAQFRRISIEQVMRRHMQQMNQFIHFDEAVSDLRRVFTDPEVKEVIFSQKGGKQLYQTLTKKIDDVARGGMATQMKLAALDQAIGNFTKASLMFNWAPFFKQLTSGPGFTLGKEGLKYTELISGAMAYYRNPVQWTKTFAKSDFIFQRLTKGFNRETALAFRAGDKNFTIKEVDMTIEEFLKKAAITPTRGGDMVPILPGMTAKYIQVTNKLKAAGGMTDAEIHQAALRRAEKLASRTQQDPNIENMGRIQTANSMGKAISMYSTTPIQFHRESVAAIRMWNRGQIPFKTLLRTLITAWIVLPQFFQWVSSGFEWNEERQFRALILGPWNYYPAASNLIGTMYDAFAKGETWKSVASGISPLFAIPEGAQRTSKDFGKIATGDADVGDWAKFAENLYKLIALTTGKLPSQAPRTIEGIIDLSSGDTKDPRRIIWSEWALDTESKTGESSVGGLEFDFGDQGGPLKDVQPLDFGF